MSGAVDLATSVGALTMPHPVMVAAGCAGSGRELDPFLDVAGLGALVTRSVTLDGRAGPPPPRVVETPAGLLTDTGLQGPGLDGFLATELPWLVKRGVRVVVSVAAGSLAEYAELARRLGHSPGVSAVEVNLGWPAGSSAGHSGYHAARVVSVVRRDLPPGIPVLAKLDPDVRAVVDVTRAVTEAGADAVVVAQGSPGLMLDPRTLRPALGSGNGLLVGPATHAAVLRCVWEVHRSLPEVPIVGVGGIRSGYDALQMVLAGARAVQVGSVMLHDPGAPVRIVGELTEQLAARGLPTLGDLVGRAHRPEGEDL